MHDNCLRASDGTCRMSDTRVDPLSADNSAAPLPVRHVPCIFDRVAALDRVDGDEEVFRELVEMFCEATPVRMSDLRTAIAERDAGRLAWTTHSLRGSLGNMGGQRAMAAAIHLEELAQANNLDQAPQAFDFLECEIKRLTLAILQQVAS